MHESKGQHIGKAPCIPTSFSHAVTQHPWDLNLLPSMQLLMLCLSIWVLHTDYYDQSAAHSSSGSRLYQRHVTRVPLSVQTYDSVVKVRHGFSLIPRQLVVRYRKTPMHCLTVVWKRCRDAWGFAYMLTFAFMHASSLPCLHTFWHAIPTSFYIFNIFYFLVYI